MSMVKEDDSILKVHISHTPLVSSASSPGSFRTPVQMETPSPLTPSPSPVQKKFGKPIKEGHINYTLMHDMLTGIRKCVLSLDLDDKRPVETADFTVIRKVAVDDESKTVATKKMDFKFKDYAPWFAILF
jgi:hypothetical protein